MEKTCQHCGKAFPSPSGRAKFCGSACRSRANRGEPAKVLELRPPAESNPDRAVMVATRAQLEEAGRVETTAGAAALALAARIDRDDDLGSAMASMVRELRATMAEALEGAAVAADGVDDLKAQAEKRRLRLAGG